MSSMASRALLLLGLCIAPGFSASCIEGDCAVHSDSVESSELYLLQTDLVVHNRGKSREKRVHVQGDGAIDSARRQALEDAVVKSQEPLKAATTTSYKPPKNAAESSGVKTNGAGDLTTFVTAVVTNTIMAMMCVGIFMLLRDRYPLTYANNLRICKLDQLPEGAFGWAKASWSVTTSTVMETAGLDQAMLLEFSNLAMRIMALIGIPMFFIMGPVHCIFGGHAAGEDHLSYFSFGNVENGSSLYWIHAVIVWAVVFIVQTSVYQAQKNFLRYRYQWLRELPNPRANTVMVEGIPDEQQSDEQLHSFFTKMFGPKKVRSAYVVKKYPALEDAWESKEAAKNALAKAKAKGDEQSQEDLLKSIAELDEQIKALQTEVNRAYSKPGAEGFNTSAGFVSFVNRTDMALALETQIGSDLDEWEVSIPPEPSCVIWNDLKQSKESRASFTVLGYILTAGLYMAYMPAVIGITQIAVKINMGPLQPMWAAFAPTMGLQFMVAFLPTFLILIFRFCFTLKDDAWAQQMLQNWYFVFQVVFVLLVTAIGGSMMEFLDTLAEKPFEIFGLLAKTMPFATHFYMNFLVLQWASHAMVLMRYIPLGKFLLFRSAGYDDEAARELSEPEDQDYYGLGARTARFTINICIGVIYGTLSPPINLLTFVEFFVCRLVYGYLLPYAETKKPDLGGVFWVQQLRHLFVGNIIYCIVMIGVLLGRSATSGPGMIAAPSLLYVIWSMNRFERAFSWERLSFTELIQGGDGDTKQKQDAGEYVQPWMKALVDATASTSSKKWGFGM